MQMCTSAHPSVRNVYNMHNLPSNINNAIRVGILGQGLRDNCLPTTESSRDSTCPTLDGRKECIKNPLTSKERRISALLLRDRARLTDRPFLDHIKTLLGSIKLNLENSFLDSILRNAIYMIQGGTAVMTKPIHNN